MSARDVGAPTLPAAGEGREPGHVTRVPLVDLHDWLVQHELHIVRGSWPEGRHAPLVQWADGAPCEQHAPKGAKEGGE